MIAKFQRLLEIENKRYRKKGLLNIVLALVLLFATMQAAWSIGQSLWPAAIEDQMTFVTLGSIIINLGMELVGFILYLPGYMGWSKYFAEHLINKKSSRPWERRNWSEVRSKTIKNFVLNQLIIYPVVIYLSNRQGIQLRFSDYPSFSEFALQILFVYYLEDFLFYCAHRLFHSYTFLYRMHKVHHEYDVLYTWVAEYLHPGDFLLANIVPPSLVSFQEPFPSSCWAAACTASPSFTGSSTRSC
jgi:hypothetical protein